MGAAYINQDVTLGNTQVDFDGQQVFKRAVGGMAQASAAAMKKAGVTATDIDLVVPHQANLRIIESVAQQAGIPMEKVMLTVSKYGNMSSATVPVALAEAVEEGRVKPGALILMPAFGAGLTYCAHVVRWGERVTPLATINEQLPAPKKTALEMVNHARAQKARRAAQSAPALSGAAFADIS